MKYLLLAVLLLSACAPHRVTLRELQEYDNAISLAESRGIDSTEMHKKLVEMVISYMKNPGEDPYTKAAREAAEGAQWAGAAAMMQAIQPVPSYQEPPMSFGQWMGR